MKIGIRGLLIVSALVFVAILGWVKASDRSLGSNQRRNEEISSLKEQLQAKLKSLDYDSSPKAEKPRIAYEAHEISKRLASFGYFDDNTLDAAIKADFYRAKPANDILEDLNRFSSMGIPKDMVKNIEEAIADIKSHQPRK